MRDVTFRPGLTLVIVAILMVGVGIPTLAYAADMQLPPSQTDGLANAAANATATAAARNAPRPTTVPPTRNTITRPNTKAVSSSPTSTPESVPETTPAGSSSIALPTPTATIASSAITTTTTATEAITILTLTIPTSDTLQNLDMITPPAKAVTITVAEGPMQGTIIANRTGALLRFFVEGETRDLEPQRSVGIQLARPTAVLNLFNCDASFGETQEGCFWDPYLLARDGFYEVVSGRDAGALVGLVLREAGTPPAGEVWIQNRTTAGEQVYFGTQMYDIPPSAIAEFSIETEGIAVFYLRTCIAGATGSVCEWTSHTGEPGTYYALVADQWAGNLPDTSITSMVLQPVLGSTAADSNPVTAQAAPMMVCRLAVPALNVRSGPGLSFEIVKKVRTTSADVATITVVARTEDGLWLKVDERIVTGGWITSDPGFLTCDGDAAALPVIASAEPAATPPPAPIAVTPAIIEPAVNVQTPPAAPVAPIAVDPAPAPVAEIVTQAPPAEATAPTTETTVITPTGPSIPPGLALIVVNNGFDQEMRFTLDQRHRVEQGPSEFDLKPGDSISILAYPGVIQFSASSAWRGISGNAEFLLDPDNQRVLWLIFVPDPGDPGNWVLMF